ncbi:hypothetical protein [Candidatus Jidaibacter acanthamoebae]|nr:hypothetical protein [Candidatus Jidaibacter acanthamoeba]
MRTAPGLDEALKDPRLEYISSSGLFPTSYVFPKEPTKNQKKFDDMSNRVVDFDKILEESRQKFDNDREVIKKLFQHVKYEEFEEAYNFFIKQSWESSSVLTNCLFPNSDPSLKKYNEAHTQLHRFLLNSSSEDKNTKLKNFYEASRSKDFHKIEEEQDKNFNIITDRFKSQSFAEAYKAQKAILSEISQGRA